ncbi:MAG: DUF4832 domain-containing protein [Clostridia bacterium]|nr:DUF4832 domain-containing protein [Clostridia bacterium]
MKKLLSLVLCALMIFSAFTFCSAADEWTTAEISFKDSLKTFERNPGRGQANTMDSKHWVTAEDAGTTYMPTAADFDEMGIYTPLYNLGAFSSGNDYTEDTSATDGNGKDRVGGVNKDIDADTLASIEECCKIAEAKGVKLIVRFAYDHDGYCGCEPDDVAWIKRHINQLTAVLNKYEGTVLAVEAGMIGPWGEMHTTQYEERKLSNQILESWENGLSDSIYILVRKMSYILNYCSMMAPKFMKSLPLTPDSEGYRFSMYNDGYLGDEGDYGTCDRPGSTETQRLYRENAIKFLKDNASRAPYGGELGYATLDHLKADKSPIYTDGFVKELYDTHLNYLRNINKSSPLINGELATLKLGENHNFEGMPDISEYYGQSLQKFMTDHMGYRFVLRSAEVSSAVKAGDIVKLRGSVENTGFGNILGEYKTQIIVADSTGKVVAVTDAYLDPYDWKSATVSDYAITLTVPADYDGKYNVYLRISGADYEHRSGSAYVSFANPDIVNYSLGANFIGSFTVSGKGGDADELVMINNGSFADVNAGKWYEEAVYYAAHYGVMGGVGVGKFDPEGTTTRAMLVQVLYNMEGKPDVSSVETPFTDISGKWYEAAVKWAYANKVVNGMTATTFSPEGKITREQFATILYRYSAYKGYATDARADLSSYTDAGKVSGYATDAMSWANSLGYIGGMTATTLVPTGNATRAQMAQIMMRFMRNN